MKSFASSPNLMRLARAFRAAGGTLYAVGGMIRNPLLGLPVSDADVCSAMRPEAVKALCEKEGFGCVPKGAAFGTLDLVVGEGCAREKFEYACFRSESYARGGAHRPEKVVYSDSLEEDALRRDFTVNAIYLDILEARAVDPTGGVADLENRLIRATSPEPGLIMGDDALRILRMARFAAQLGFSIDPATLDAARAHARGLRDISPERVWEELIKLLLADARYGAGRESLLYGLEALRSCGAYEIILPELASGAGIAQKAQYHAYDVLGHSLRATAAAPPALSLRLAMLLHDVGKPVSLADSGSMHGHELAGAELADAALRRLRCPNALRSEVVTLVRWHMYDLKGEARECKVRRRFVALGKDIARKLCDVREADVHGSGLWDGPVPTAERWREILSRMEREGAPFTEGELACTGEDIASWLSIGPGKRIGEIKRALLMHCACKPGDNTKEKLRALARDMQRGEPA